MTDSQEQRFQSATAQRFDRLEGRFDHLEGRFDRLEGRFGHLEERFSTSSKDVSTASSTIWDPSRAPTPETPPARKLP